MTTLRPADADDLLASPTLHADVLKRRYNQAPAAETEILWRQAAKHGTPVWSRDNEGHWSLATFLWRAVSSAEDPHGVESVHVHVNRVTDKEHHESGYMQHIPGTDIWVLTLKLSPGLRACYGFMPLLTGEHPPGGPPQLGVYATRLDPLNPLPPLIDRGDHGLSVLRGQHAPAQPEWEGRPEWESSSTQIRGRLIRESRALPRDAERPRDHWLYLPPPDVGSRRLADSGTAAMPLVTLFDAETWFGDMPLPHALESAMRAGRLPPTAVLGIAHHDRLDRLDCLGSNARFLTEVAGSATSWATARAAEHGIRFAGRAGRVLAGQSLGGLSALYAALELPQAYGTVLAQSPSLWWTPETRATPRDLGTRSGGDWITERFSRTPPGATRIRLDVGAREGLTVPQTEILARTLDERGWENEMTIYDGGHDFAWWRGALLDGLGSTLTSCADSRPE